MMRLSWLLALKLGLSGCNVTAADTTGGIELPSQGECPRGLVAMQSDFQSSELALLSPRGSVASAAFLSSASSEASGLAAPLSGDIVLGSGRTLSGEVALIDRLGTNVLSFVAPSTADVRAQLPIGTGFESNPQDYLQLDAHKAYVPRLGDNAEPGRAAFDAGSDVLIVDPSVPEIVGSIAMPRRAGFLPNPASIIRLGGEALVVLQHARPDYSGMAEGELVAVDVASDAISYRIPLRGLQNCGRPRLSPSGGLLAIACSAFVDRKGGVQDPEASALILFDPKERPPLELWRYTASELVGAPLQSSVEFASESVLLIKSQTALGAALDNQLFALALDTGQTRLLATARRGEAGLGYGVAFGGVSCLPGCTDLCLVADASRGQVLAFDAAYETFEALPPISIGGSGLPPTSLTPYW